MQTGAFGNITGEHPKNLYDVVGNVSEWVNEMVATKGEYMTQEDNVILRGGSYTDSGSFFTASLCLGNHSSTDTNDFNSAMVFRIVLYIL